MKELSIPLLAAFFYGVKPIFAKAGLRLSNEPLLGAAIGILTSLVVHTVFFAISPEAAPRRRSSLRGLVFFCAAGLLSTLAIFCLFLAMRSLPALIVAPLTATVPLVTLGLSYIVLRDVETLTKSDVLGTLLIVAGVILLIR